MVIVGGITWRMHPGQSGVGRIGVPIVFSFIVAPSGGWSGNIAAGIVGGTVLVVEWSLDHT